MEKISIAKPYKLNAEKKDFLIDFARVASEEFLGLEIKKTKVVFTWKDKISKKKQMIEGLKVIMFHRYETVLINCKLSELLGNVNRYKVAIEDFNESSKLETYGKNIFVFRDARKLAYSNVPISDETFIIKDIMKKYGDCDIELKIYNWYFMIHLSV